MLTEAGHRVGLNLWLPGSHEASHSARTLGSEIRESSCASHCGFASNILQVSWRRKWWWTIDIPSCNRRLDPDELRFASCNRGSCETMATGALHSPAIKPARTFGPKSRAYFHHSAYMLMR